MVDVFIKEISNTVAIAANDAWYVEFAGSKLSEGLPARFVPVLAVSVLNKSANEIKVFVNESEDNSFRLPANSSRTIEGIPIWDIAIRDMDGVEIAIGDVALTLLNDLEQVGRYNAYSKGRGF